MTFYDLDTVFGFGKYKGDTVREVFERDPAYIEHCLVNVDEFLVEDFVLDDLKELNPEFAFSAEALAQVDEKWARYESDAYNEEDNFYLDDEADLYGSKNARIDDADDDEFDKDDFDDEFTSLDDLEDDDYDNDYDDNW